MLGRALAGISKSVASAVEVNSSLLSNFYQPLLTHSPHVERVPLARALVNCSDVFVPVVTDSGVCCGFNVNTELKKSDYSDLVQELQVRI